MTKENYGFKEELNARISKVKQDLIEGVGGIPASHFQVLIDALAQVFEDRHLKFQENRSYPEKDKQVSSEQFDRILKDFEIINATESRKRFGMNPIDSSKGHKINSKDVSSGIDYAIYLKGKFGNRQLNEAEISRLGGKTAASGCQENCQGFCTSCQGACEGTCSGNCEGSCTGSCQGNCSGWCTGACGGCGGTCAVGNCTGTCYDGVAKAGWGSCAHLS